MFVARQCMRDESVRTLKIFTGGDGNITTLLDNLQCSSVQSSAMRGRGAQWVNNLNSAV